MTECLSELDHYLRRLFPLCRSIMGEYNRETLQILKEIIPVKILEIPTGTVVYDWTIPEEWWIRDAWIADANGHKIVNFQENNLHLVSYSIPINTNMYWQNLKPHIHKHPEIATAIPYRTSYYKRDWGFCVSHAQFRELETHEGPLKVVIDSGLKSGSLSYGEILIPGKSTKEILISCYICHPSMANDSLSGVVLTAFLARYISCLKNRYWSYRIVFVPETIGAIAYCAKNEKCLKDVDLGLVITTVGGPGQYSYKQTKEQGHWLNGTVEKVLTKANVPYKVFPFDADGSDERQYSSPGFGINCVTISKDKYYDYPQYHTSLDNLDFVKGSQIKQTLDIYKILIDTLEQKIIYKRSNPFCEPMLSKYDMHSQVGGAYLPEKTNSLLNLVYEILAKVDGNTPLDDMLDYSAYGENSIEMMIEKLESLDLIERI